MPRVLVIDDDDTMREMLVQMMEREGIESVSAEDGHKGLRLLQREEIELVITDIVMPRKEGLETIMNVRKKYPEIPIIAVSGGGKIGAESYLPMAREFGARFVFAKPLIRKEFVAAIKECLGTAG